jgi:hypothetical protein
MWDGSWEKGGWNENRGRMEEGEMKMAGGRNGRGRRHGWRMSRW